MSLTLKTLIPLSIPRTTTPLLRKFTTTTKPYRLLLSPSSQLPVYQLSKRGGNMALTKIKNIEGDVAALQADLRKTLNVVEEKEVTINQLTGHIIVKGHRKHEITQYFEKHKLGFKQEVELL